MEKYFTIFTIASVFIKTSHCDFSHFRSKRTLIVPPTSPTRHQLISGIGIPLQLEREAITLGLTMKAQYLLGDTNATSFKPVYFPGVFNTSGPNMQIFDSQNNQNSPFPSYFGRRKRAIKSDATTGEKVEIYEGDVKETGNEELKNEIPEHDEEFEDEYPGDYEFEYERFPLVSDFPRPNEQALKDTSSTRWLMYDGLADLLHKQGINGRECVLKSICEAAEVNFTHHSGIFGEIFHILFSPSSSHDEIVRWEHFDYTEAERNGAAGKPCVEIYKNCKVSVMEMFSKIYA